MVQPTAKETSPTHAASILERSFVEHILFGAQENLRRDGALAPVLFFRSQDNVLGILPLALPETTEEKYAYFGLLGVGLIAAGKEAQEALFLSETWYLAAKPGLQLEEEIRPREHPQRREAITIVGRDRLRSHFTFVVQLFHRDARNRFVFGAKEVEEYNIRAAEGIEAVGLLDALFPTRSSIQ